ncbi:hypothetical protein SDJN02_07117, partial [Cucurbita argyrosperma subsp. argyrosperma]
MCGRKKGSEGIKGFGKSESSAIVSGCCIFKIHTLFGSSCWGLLAPTPLTFENLDDAAVAINGSITPFFNFECFCYVKGCCAHFLIFLMVLLLPPSSSSSPSALHHFDLFMVGVSPGFSKKR